MDFSDFPKIPAGSYPAVHCENCVYNNNTVARVSWRSFLALSTYYLILWSGRSPIRIKWLLLDYCVFSDSEVDCFLVVTLKSNTMMILCRPGVKIKIMQQDLREVR